YEWWADHFMNPVVVFAQVLLFQSGNDPVRCAFWARLPIMLLGTGLVLAVFFWGRQLYGPGPALLGTALCASCPNLIAHAGLATEDLGCSALMFGAAWTFWLACHRPRWWRWAVCGLVTGLALVSKYTAILILPAFTIIVVVQMTRRRMTPAVALRA